MDVYEEMGKRIAESRKEKGLSQEELAKRVNSTQGLIAKVETGNRKIQVDLLAKIADILEIDCDYLVRGKKTEHLSIAENTGLNETAIGEIKKMHFSDRTYERYQLYAINALLSSPEGRNVLMQIATYLNCDFSQFYVVDDSGDSEPFKRCSHVVFGNNDSSVGTIYTSLGKDSLEYAEISILTNAIKLLKQSMYSKKEEKKRQRADKSAKGDEEK